MGTSPVNKKKINVKYSLTYSLFVEQAQIQDRMLTIRRVYLHAHTSRPELRLNDVSCSLFANWQDVATTSFWTAVKACSQYSTFYTIRKVGKCLRLLNTVTFELLAKEHPKK